jgi:hypothetical protein
MARAVSPELPVILKTYDLVLWSCRHIAKFPRSYRFTLGERLERRLYGLLETPLKAKYTWDKTALLQAVNLDLELARFQFRLAYDLHCLNADSYGFAAQSVNEIGKMVGGWLRSLGHRRNAA